jgi:hypothetical protein
MPAARPRYQNQWVSGRTRLMTTNPGRAAAVRTKTVASKPATRPAPIALRCICHLQFADESNTAIGRHEHP